MSRRGVRPSKARYLSEVSAAMAKALVRCHTMDVPANAGTRPKGIRVQTLHALERHGLATIEAGLRDGKGRLKPALWRLTESGKRIVTADEPRLLTVALDDGYTHELGKAALGEPEAVDADMQEKISDLGTLRHRQDQQLRQAEHERDRTLSDRLTDLLAIESHGNVDISRLIASIRRRIEQAEAKARQAA